MSENRCRTLVTLVSQEPRDTVWWDIFCVRYALLLAFLWNVGISEWLDRIILEREHGV
jgi:hypothetical protein